MNTNLKNSYKHAFERAKSILDNANMEGRELKDEEKTRFKTLFEEASRYKGQIDAERENLAFRRQLNDIADSGSEPFPEGAFAGQREYSGGLPRGSLAKSLKAAGLDPAAGKFTARIPSMKAALARGNAPTPAAPYLYERLPSAEPDEDGLGFSDFTVTGDGTITGEINWGTPIGSGSKAVLDRNVEWVQGKMDQIALIINDIPTSLLGPSAFESFAEAELTFQIRRAIDGLVVDSILIASPPGGSTGDDLIAQIRNGVSAMRDVGSNPSILVVDPSVGAALDLTKSTGGSEEYLFPPRASGSASPLFNLSIVEVADVEDPILIDPERLGVVRLGRLDTLIDPFTGFDVNLVNIRMEALASFHVRNDQGAYVISAGSGS